MVKAAFLDSDLQAQRPLTSANSINIARWMPQSIYYAWATYLLGQPAQFSVPSGNVGNLAAGVLAAQMGMPHAGFIAATNANDGLNAFLNGSEFVARPSVATLSNAMDVGDPSNRPRLEALFGQDLAAMRAVVRGATLDDAATQRVMKDVADRTGCVMCPHTAVGYAGLTAHRNPAVPGVVLATAHPAKFGEVVEKATGQAPEIPAHLADCLSRTKEATVIPPAYDALKAYLLR